MTYLNAFLCGGLLGLNKAPVGANTSRRHRPRRRPSSRYPFSTAAEQPQPEPPACMSCFSRSYSSIPQS